VTTPVGRAGDRGFMEQALALAALGEGSASPNPRVGCVVVRHGLAVGRGFHRAAGEPHAEEERRYQERAEAGRHHGSRASRDAHWLSQVSTTV